VLLSVNDQVLPEAATIAAERNSATRRRLMARADLLIHDALREGPARLRLRRGAETIELTLLPSYGCPSFARLARSPQLNAFADGRYAIATTRLLDFVRSDDELAIALAHEMAHNVLGHPAALEAKGASRGGSSSAGAGHQAIKDREMEADRLGLKLAWAAGYDIGAAPAFWARLRQATLAVSSTTHPGLDEREDLLRQVLAELETLKPGTHGPELRESALAER
jgi:Zn-dependent protease with chaperone function